MIHTAEVLTGFERRGIMAFKMLEKMDLQNCLYLK